MKIRTGDKVKIIAGKDKGKESIVEKVLTESNKVLVTDVNMVKKHIKRTEKEKGGIVSVNRPIDASNVMIVCPKTKKPTRIGIQLINGKKVRISKKSKEAI